MNAVEKLKLENKLLRNQLTEASEKIYQGRHVITQIADFSAKLGSPVKLHEIYRNCLHLFKDLLTLDFTTLFLVSDDQEGLVIYDTLGFPESLVGQFTVCKGVGLPGLVFESEQLETVKDFRTEKRFSIPAVIHEKDIRSAIAVPMMHNQKLFGVIIGHTIPKVRFSKEEQSLAEIFGNLSATAIKNATHIQSLNISEQNLKQRTNEIETIFASSMVGIMLLKGDRILTRCNQRFADFMGYESPEEMQGHNMRKFHLTEERYFEIGKYYQDLLVSGKEVQLEYQLRKKDGQPLWCSLSGKTIDQNFPPDLNNGVVWIIDDISQRKKMEEQLLKSQKLESIEILTSGLAHDFNNIITAILGNINLSLASVEPESTVYSFLLPAKEASLRAKDLTRQLQAFSQESIPTCHRTHLKPLIEDAIASVTTDHSINIHSEFDDNLWQADIDRLQILKALRILLQNSIEAMPDGGDIGIKCTNTHTKDELIELKASQYVKITITDTGHGIPSSIIDKIFDPYFTTRTRDSNKGRGLGLATVHAIIKRHKGAISVASEANSRTTFALYLVASPGSKINTTQNKSTAKKPSFTKGKGNILVMDDDEDIRNLLQQMLTLLGYKVQVAADGEEAIGLYRANLDTKKRFDAVIMDLTIPNGMGGVDAMKKLLQIDKDAYVIVSSGNPNDPAMTNYQEYGFIDSIDKPFDFKELHQKLSFISSS